jgi:AcrR family transcriptional regulator
VTKPRQRAPDKMGRPRLFDDDTERRMVMDAAVKVMARNGYAAMSVADVLAEVGLSTSSFYRHFTSKEVLLAELVRREAESARRYVQRAIEKAAGPTSALEAWLDAVLDLFFESNKAARTSVFSTPQVMSSPWMTEAILDMRSYPSDPLVEVLRAGHESGQLHSPTPDADAVCIFAMLSNAATSPRAFPGDRAAVRALVVRFAWPALRVGDTAEPSQKRPRRSHRSSTEQVP